MSKPKTKRRPKPSTPVRFKIGDHVRVRRGARDVDHPDIPLGGWAGMIFQVNNRRILGIQWSRETLASIHPIYKKRCAIDGTVLEQYWLGEEDLEPDPGGPLAIEQPSHITPRPLSRDNQGDRVRMVFGLTSDDRLPDVDEDSLETYYDHLVEQMSLPAVARHCPHEDFFNPLPLRNVQVVALDREIGWDEDEGVLCEIRTADGEDVVPLSELVFRRSDPNHQRVDDFVAWFVGDLSECMDDEDAEEDGELEDGDYEDAPQVLEKVTWRSVTATLLEITAFAVTFGAVVGSAVAVMSGARWAAFIGAGAWGAIVAISHVRYAGKNGRFVVPRLQKVADGIIGAITGALYGALFGIMAVAFIGAVLGGIAGVVLRRLVRGRKWLILYLFPNRMMFPIACGVTAQAFYLDRTAAASGLEHGALIGLMSGLFLCLVALPFAISAIRETSRRGI